MRNTNDIRKTVGKNIVRLRKTLGFSQETLAEQLSLATTSLSGIETGKSLPKPENIEAIAKALNIKPFELFIEYEKVEDVNVENTYEPLLKILEAHKDNSIFVAAIYEFALNTIKRANILK